MMRTQAKTDKMEAALEYAAEGLAVFPVMPNGKRPIGKLVPNGVKDATTDEQKIRDWWGSVPSANIGIATDEKFAVDLDCDNKKDGKVTWKERTADKAVPETRAVITPSDGVHLYYRAPEGVTIKNSVGELGEGVDVRGHGGYVIAPPSSREDGVYRFRNGKRAIAKAPYWLVSEVEKKEKKGHGSEETEPLEVSDTIQEGERNDTLFRIGCSLRERPGMSETELRPSLHQINKVRCSPPLSSTEVDKIVDSIVQRYDAGVQIPGVAGDGQRSDPPSAAGISVNGVDGKEEPTGLEGASVLPDVYEDLPEPLQTASQTFDQRHERDVFLTSSIPVLGSCMSNVRGYYGHTPEPLTPHSYTAIVAGAAGGKGPVNWGRRLGEKVNEYIVEKSKEVRRNWEDRKREHDEDAEGPFTEPEPPEKSLFLPANTSAAAFHRGLKERDERALVVETEIDTMLNALGQEWGKYDDTLRKAYHHEPTMYRRKDEGNVELANPRLSVVLSGTPRQYRDLMGSAENGLYSRFPLYYFEAPPVWISQKPTSEGLDALDRFERYGEQVLEMYKALSQRETPIRFRLTDAQWELHEKVMRPLLYEAVEKGYGHLTDVYKRAGIVAFRIAMVLTVLRAAQNDVPLGVTDELEAERTDVMTALDLADTYADHSARFADDHLEEVEPVDASSQRIAVMLGSVESEFASGDAYNAAKAAGIEASERTLQRDLRRAEKRGLIRATSKNGDWAKRDADPVSDLSDLSDPTESS